MNLRMTKASILGCFCLVAFASFASSASSDDLQDTSQPRVVRAAGETPTILTHYDQADLEAGRMKLKDIISQGRMLFDARCNSLDGQGRPAATGNGTPTKRDRANNPGFIRTSGTDANSCAGCHNQPFSGGGGDFVANVFVLAQVRDPIVTSVDAEFSNERNTLGMNGSGAIEMLAREMSVDLIAIRTDAAQQAASQGTNVTSKLLTKGVSFGQITARPDGTFDTSGVEGVDADLVIKPFHQKGVVVSLREFTNNAYNHHHGMQSVERFGAARTGTNDFDEDGVVDELTVGDITAATIFQAAMGAPGVVMPTDRTLRDSVARGETTFSQIGCAECHVPELRLVSTTYSEANPFNPPGNLRPIDMVNPITFDLTRDTLGPNLERAPGGGAIVRAFTDLKRHTIWDAEDPYFNNERLVQGGVPTGQFLTRKLWDVGNSAPYGHRGDLTTMTEAILHHAGEGRPSREAFEALSTSQRADVIEFLKTMQALPDGSPRVITDADLAKIYKRIRTAARFLTK